MLGEAVTDAAVVDDAGLRHVDGAHAGGFNTGTVGVSMMGNYDVVNPPQPMIDAVYERSRYARRLDYGKALTPPLTPEETVWLKQRLQELAGTSPARAPRRSRKRGRTK